MTDKGLILNELLNARLMLTPEQRESLNIHQELFKQKYPDVVTSEIYAMNKLIFFTYNYKTSNPSGIPRFITNVKWTTGSKHMVDKWKYIVFRFPHENSVLRFYLELDTENRRLMLDYIIRNYQTEPKL